MMGCWSIFVKPVIFASIFIFVQTSAIVFNTAAVKLPWMVSVLRENSTADGFMDFVCDGVIVHPHLIYVAAISVEGINPLDLNVLVQNPNSSSDPIVYAVDLLIPTNTVKYSNHALLFLSHPVENAQILPLPNDNESANSSNCLTSIPHNEMKPQFKVSATFKFLTYGRPVDTANPENWTASGGQSCDSHKCRGGGEMEYGSPLVCSSQKDSSRYLLIGWAQLNFGNVTYHGLRRTHYEYKSGGRQVYNWINFVITFLEQIQKDSNWRSFIKI